MTEYQFVIDNIPEKDLNTFLNWMENFRNQTNCQFRYKNKAGVKYPIMPVPNHEEAQE